MITLRIQSRERTEFIDVTDQIQAEVSRRQWESGVVIVFVPHTTAGCTINENADPDVVRDMTVYFNKAVPHAGDYRHAEGNSDSHIKASLFGASQTVIVEKGELVLGTWQGIYFCEFDGPRSRQLHVTFLRHDP